MMFVDDPLATQDDLELASLRARVRDDEGDWSGGGLHGGRRTAVLADGDLDPFSFADAGRGSRLARGSEDHDGRADQGAQADRQGGSISWYSGTVRMGARCGP